MSSALLTKHQPGLILPNPSVGLPGPDEVDELERDAKEREELLGGFVEPCLHFFDEDFQFHHGQTRKKAISRFRDIWVGFASRKKNVLEATRAWRRV